MSRSLGSLKAAWIWLVKAPGVKRPAMELQPMYLQREREGVKIEGDKPSN